MGCACVLGSNSSCVLGVGLSSEGRGKPSAGAVGKGRHAESALAETRRPMVEMAKEAKLLHRPAIQPTYLRAKVHGSLWRDVET